MKPALFAFAVGSILVVAVSAVFAQPRVTHVSGDKEAVWIVTEKNRLIYCWWNQDPSRPDSRAECKVVDRFNLDRLK